jgi:hypothetical protein
MLNFSLISVAISLIRLKMKTRKRKNEKNQLWNPIMHMISQISKEQDLCPSLVRVHENTSTAQGLEASGRECLGEEKQQERGARQLVRG